MRIGPITIRWTKTAEAQEQFNRDTHDLDIRVTAGLLAENTDMRAKLHRWGLDEGLVDQGASGKSKTPKGAGAHL